MGLTTWQDSTGLGTVNEQNTHQTPNSLPMRGQTRLHQLLGYLAPGSSFAPPRKPRGSPTEARREMVNRVCRKRKHGLGGGGGGGGGHDAPQHLSPVLEKRIFRSGHKRTKTAAFTPTVAPADDMNELVGFIVAHEEAFQRFVVP